MLKSASHAFSQNLS